jgi:hypothetical protein
MAWLLHFRAYIYAKEDSEGQKYELVKDFGITSHKVGETFSN